MVVLAATAILAPAAILAAMFSTASAATGSSGESLPAIERQVMCVTCKIPLNEAESPQAAREKAFIAGLIARGRSEAQIKSALVDQYGPSVLALPRAKGFDLAVYLVPILVVLALATLLAILLPSWRRRTRQRPRQSGPEVELNANDAARLDADLAHFD